MDDMNYSVSCDLRPLDAMNCSGLWMLIKIIDHDLKPLYAMNNPKL